MQSSQDTDQISYLLNPIFKALVRDILDKNGLKTIEKEFKNEKAKHLIITTRDFFVDLYATNLKIQDVRNIFKSLKLLRTKQRKN